MFEDWPQTYRWILLNALGGELRGSREGWTKDAGPFTLKVGKPPFVLIPGRGGSVDFARAEQLCYLSGSNASRLLKFAPSYHRFALKNGPDKSSWSWPGSYGPRLSDALPKVVEMLARYPDTRQAVAPIYSQEDLDRAGSLAGVDIPCTLNLVYWRQNYRINCHAIMRSSDVWFGTYYDLPAFYFLQCRVAEALQLPPGTLWFTTSSLHIYDKHWERAEAVIGNELPEPEDGFLQLNPEAVFMTNPPASMTSSYPYERFCAMQGLALAELDHQEAVTLPA